MSVSALLRFTPVYTSAILDEPKLARSLMVQRGALEMLERDGEIPVVVDHQEERHVGVVREVFIAPDVVAGVVQDWYWARVELRDPPGWLKRNGGVSWSYHSLQAQDVNGSTRLLRGGHHRGLHPLSLRRACRASCAGGVDQFAGGGWFLRSRRRR